MFGIAHASPSVIEGMLPGLVLEPEQRRRLERVLNRPARSPPAKSEPPPPAKAAKSDPPPDDWHPTLADTIHHVERVGDRVRVTLHSGTQPLLDVVLEPDAAAQLGRLLVQSAHQAPPLDLVAVARALDRFAVLAGAKLRGHAAAGVSRLSREFLDFASVHEPHHLTLLNRLNWTKIEESFTQDFAPAVRSIAKGTTELLSFLSKRALVCPAPAQSHAAALAAALGKSCRVAMKQRQANPQVTDELRQTCDDIAGRIVRQTISATCALNEVDALRVNGPRSGQIARPSAMLGVGVWEIPVPS